MAIFGPDFRDGLARPLYSPANPAGLGWAIGIFLLLIVGTQVLLIVFGVVFLALTANDLSDLQGLSRSLMMSLLPAGLVMAVVALLLARIRGGRPETVLSLRVPALGWAGWIAVAAGFLVLMYALVIAAVYLFSIDVESRGEVEKMMAGLASDSTYPLVAAGVAIAIPLAEELTFRGQIFAALSGTRLGFAGTSVVTSFMWAIAHITEPWHGIGLIFVMGLVLSALLIRFGSLWVTFICHALWNGLYSAALLALPQA